MTLFLFLRLIILIYQPNWSDVIHKKKSKKIYESLEFSDRSLELYQHQ